MVSTLKESAQNSVVAVFAQHSGAENAVKELKDSRFDVKKLSIVGSDYHSNEDVVGFYNIGDRMKYWGKTGAFWGGLWGMLFGAAFLVIPGIGPIIAAGPYRGLDHRRLGRRGYGWRDKRFGGGTIQPRYPEGQRGEVRDVDQSRKVFADRARNCR